jgi:hypothetical protein
LGLLSVVAQSDSAAGIPRAQQFVIWDIEVLEFPADALKAFLDGDVVVDPWGAD